MTATFFGLTQEYKLDVHRAIFNLVTHGKGGWSWKDVYNLPIWLRNFYISELMDYTEKQRNAAANAPKGKKKIQGPAISRR